MSQPQPVASATAPDPKVKQASDQGGSRLVEATKRLHNGLSALLDRQEERLRQLEASQQAAPPPSAPALAPSTALQVVPGQPAASAAQANAAAAQQERAQAQSLKNELEAAQAELKKLRAETAATAAAVSPTPTPPLQSATPPAVTPVPAPTVTRTVIPSHPYYQMGLTDGKNGSAPQGVSDEEFGFQYQAGYSAGQAARQLEQEQHATKERERQRLSEPIDDLEERVAVYRQIVDQSKGYCRKATLDHLRDSKARPVGSVNRLWMYWAIARDTLRLMLREHLGLDSEAPLPDGLGEAIDAAARAVRSAGTIKGTWDQEAATAAFENQVVLLEAKANELQQAQKALGAAKASSKPAEAAENGTPDSATMTKLARAELVALQLSSRARLKTAIGLYFSHLKEEELKARWDDVAQAERGLHINLVDEAKKILAGAPNEEAEQPLVNQWLESQRTEACNRIAVEQGYTSFATVRSESQKSAIRQLAIVLVARGMNQNDPAYLATRKQVKLKPASAKAKETQK